MKGKNAHLENRVRQLLGNDWQTLGENTISLHWPFSKGQRKEHPNTTEQWVKGVGRWLKRVFRVMRERWGCVAYHWMWAAVMLTSPLTFSSLSHSTNICWVPFHEPSWVRDMALLWQGWRTVEENKQSYACVMSAVTGEAQGPWELGASVISTTANICWAHALCLALFQVLCKKNFPEISR